MIKKILLKGYYIILNSIRYIKYLYGKIYFFNNYKNINKDLDLGKINKVLFISHPDDESLFFYKELKNYDGWLVVCLTNGGNKIRQKEFSEAMTALKVQYIMLNFIDGNINWNKNKVKHELMNILKIKNYWNMVVTHNFEGEYGHKQHKFLNKMVSQVYLGDNLYTSIPNKLLSEKCNKLSDKEKKEKKYFLKKYYKSQDVLAEHLTKYYDYEGIIKVKN